MEVADCKAHAEFICLPREQKPACEQKKELEMGVRKKKGCVINETPGQFATRVFLRVCFEHHQQKRFSALKAQQIFGQFLSKQGMMDTQIEESQLATRQFAIEDSFFVSKERHVVIRL